MESSMRMNSNIYKIEPSSFVTDIVTHDFRTADVFRKYNIDFCCGGKWPLDIVCQNNNLGVEIIVNELQAIVNQSSSNAAIDFDSWDLDFLTDYILNVHHRYLKKALPEAKEQTRKFLDGHLEKYPELAILEVIINRFMKEIPPHMKQEEEIFFPYIKQIYHAHKHRESYARLLIRTLRKPLEEVMLKEHETTGSNLHHIRKATNNYTPPSNACITHKVTFAKLRELDKDLVQHIHLESNILFPKAIKMEQELLQDK
ncbi:MAG: iron-sulfur cluster repair di-iron protein [Bacteroidetes bacterium]|nr:MAG: iron-sulfur cluster repair di-iron protein [Bacteroidota bacterium]